MIQSEEKRAKAEVKAVASPPRSEGDAEVNFNRRFEMSSTFVMSGSDSLKKAFFFPEVLTKQTEPHPTTSVNTNTSNVTTQQGSARRTTNFLKAVQSARTTGTRGPITGRYG